MNGTELMALGLKGKQIGVAQRIITSYGLSAARVRDDLPAVITQPAAWTGLEPWADLAFLLNEGARLEETRIRDALHDPRPYAVFGREMIQQAAIDQMDVAMRLPISRRGALMADAHKGYGLPIGGVLETENAVIPYGVGVDIGCSVMLTVLRDAPAESARFDDNTRTALGALLKTRTSFGRGCEGFGETHAVLDDPRWQTLPKELRHLQALAARQLGSQGGGNHFVEWGVHTKAGHAPELALMSHFGSRGVGAQIAAHFTRLAESLHPHLPAEAKKLAWLDMSAEGQSYWDAMELAAAFAQAGHELTHQRLTREMRQMYPTTLTLFNTHNLAWKQEGGLIVHRKGATPAEQGRMGIIPSSMATPAYVVAGKGDASSLLSASHGAGRVMGRREAERTLKPEDVQAYLRERGITKIGGGIDEAPQAYKNGAEVMAAQSDLVEVLGTFQPVIVRMADDDFAED